MYNDDIVYDDVECDGCGAVLAACTDEEWMEWSKDYILCSRCTPACCCSDTHRRVGNYILAAQMERQWVINRSIWNYDGSATDSNEVPF